MTQHFKHQVTGRTEYLTPKYIIDEIGPFDLDPCASVIRPWPTAAKHYTINDGGLAQEWEGFVWLNPPYGREEPEWVERFMLHGNGIALLSASKTETKMWHDWIWPKMWAIVFLRGRIRFCNVDGTETPSSFGPSCLVAAGGDAARRLGSMKSPGFFIRLAGRYLPLDGETI